MLTTQEDETNPIENNGPTLRPRGMHGTMAAILAQPLAAANTQINTGRPNTEGIPRRNPDQYSAGNPNRSANLAQSLQANMHLM